MAPLDSASFAGYCGAGEMSPDPYLPFVDHCAPHTMLLRDGSVLGMARLAGAPFGLAADTERNGHVIRLVAFFNAIADSNVEAFLHFVRHDDVPPAPPRPAPAGDYDALFLDEWDRDVAAQLRANEWFLSVLVRPRSTPMAAAWKAAKRVNVVAAARSLFTNAAQEAEDELDDERAAHEDRLAQLEDAFALARGLLRHLGPVRLGERLEDSGVTYSEIAEALELIRTTKREKMPMVHPPGTMGLMLAISDPIAGRGGFEVRYGSGGTDNHFGQIYGITTHPREIAQEPFDDLLAIEGRVVLTNHIRFMNRAQQQEHMKHMRRLLETGDENNEDAEEELRDATKRVAMGHEMRAFCRWSLAIHADPDADADSPRQRYRTAMRKVDTLYGAAKTVMANAGFKIAPEGRGAKCALIAQTPGAPRRCQIRMGTLPTDYFVLMATCGGYARGPSSFRWSAPVLRYATSGGTAFDDDLFVGDGNSAVGHCVVLGPNGEGKAQPLDARVLTPTGFRQMGELRLGDLVLSPDGKAAPIVGVFPQGEKDIYRVTFEDGRVVECCDDHLWKTWHCIHNRETGKNHASRRTIPGGGRWVVKSLAEIRRVLDHGGAIARGIAVPFVEPCAIEFPPAALPVPPYALGAILGDGNLAKCGVRISTADAFILSRVMSDLPAYKAMPDGAYDYKLTLRDWSAHTTGRRGYKASETTTQCSRADGRTLLLPMRGEARSIRELSIAHGVSERNIRRRVRRLNWTPEEAVGVTTRSRPTGAFSPLMIDLAKLGLAELKAHDKFVPEAYKRGSAAQRLAVIQGLMDTDGSVERSGTHATFCSTSHRLAEDVQEIVWSLGGQAKIAQRQTFYTYNGEKKAGRPSWRVSIVHPDISCLFSLPRKLTSCKAKTTRQRLRIMSVEFVGRKQAQCISVDHPDHLYVTDQYVVTHNTVWLAAQITAARALLRAQRRPGTQILFDVGHSNEQTILANGGSYLSILAGEDSGVAPLRLPNTRMVRAMLRYLIAGLCAVPGEPLPAADVAGIRDGVDFVMNEMAPEERHLGVVRCFMGFEQNGAGARLERWCRQFDGDLAWALDGLKHLIDFDVELAGVDLSAVKDNPDVMPPMGNTLLWLAAQMMDGRRMIVWCEEAPSYFDKDEFSSMGKAMALRARKQNACFNAIAQMPEHILETEAGKAIIKQARKFVLFRNTGAERADYVDGLGVPEPVFEMVRKKMFGLPYHAVLIFRRDGQSSVNRFDLSRLPHHLAIFSGTTNSVRLWRSIAAEHGSSGRKTLEEFWRRLPEAAA